MRLGYCKIPAICPWQRIRWGLLSVSAVEHLAWAEEPPRWMRQDAYCAGEHGDCRQACSEFVYSSCFGRALPHSRFLHVCLLLPMQVTQTVAVAMQCCLQEKLYNPFYGLVLSRLCGICGCGAASVGGSAACTCFLLSEKGAARYRRTVQRGLAAQASAAHGFSLRRLLNLAKLTAYLVSRFGGDIAGGTGSEQQYCIPAAAGTDVE